MKPKRSFVLGMVWIFAVTGALAQNSQDLGFVDVGPVAFKKVLTEKQGQLLDVRTPEEFAEGYIAGAKNLNFFDAGFQKNLEQLDKSQPVYVYCRSGGRSGKTLEKLKEMGFTHVVNLAGGMIAWQKEGMPVEKPKP